jgi:phage terminase large subunit GpA-like protein
MQAVATHPTAAVNFQAMLARAYALFAPPPDITVSQWAVQNRILPKGTSSRPGPFKPEKYQIQLMDAILDPNVRRVVVMKSTQVGFSDGVLNNIIGYFVDVDPRTIMMVQPTIDNATQYGKKRITPMIQACPALRAKIKDPTARRSGNTLQLKEFPGGWLKLTGANSGAGLRSDPVSLLLLDEVDGYPLDVEGEGSPIDIAIRRTDAFPDAKIVMGSTPAKPKGLSVIEREFEASDKRRFFVPCPFCGHKQALWWRDPQTKEYRLFYEVTADHQVNPASVAFICSGCKGKIGERYKQAMLNAGEWVAEFPGRSAAGFQITALYAPWKDNWCDLAIEWNDANREKNPEKLKAFVTLRLAECWEEQGDAIEALTLKSRLEEYQAEVPDGVGLLTASVDVQNDRLECVVKGWGDKEESWLIGYQQLFGDPGQEEVWNELDSFLLSTWEHPSGQKVKISSTMIDSGGQHTDSVYKFVRARQGRRIFALKGSSESGKEILGKFSVNNAYRVKLFTIGTDTAKDRIFARLKIPAPGPAYIHLPSWCEDEYLAQLTSEKAVRRYRRGKGTIREYIKTRARNEALDLEVYALAALYVLGQAAIRKLGELAAALRLPPEPPTGGNAGPQGGSGGTSGGSGGVRRGSNWIDGWKT